MTVPAANAAAITAVVADSARAATDTAGGPADDLRATEGVADAGEPGATPGVAQQLSGDPRPVTGTAGIPASGFADTAPSASGARIDALAMGGAEAPAARGPDPVVDPDAAFDVAFRRRAPRLDCRAETPDDRAFLIAQWIACSPLADRLPDAILVQQAEWQLDAHAHAHPRAMRRIATLDDRPIGRIMIDWDGPESYGVDMAVLPEFRATGVGLNLLRAWLAVCDRRGQGAWTEALADNPVGRIHAHLGFVADPPDRYGSPVIALRRPVRATSAA
ncbi:GNAT family N-acetyltransferase [Sphingomonas donggukensis]|uniref:GNAT family N-acetyltransferase n=1 Tax=Sphingomonas donggukensis TaxID=2949093 RepID=A0ABY4TR83_9SPHN|nr:GNAT family N-acetyltransferase [Sphingomonas donggukensis]URW74897.1 GNAT family N-acetyltransferase [Sphingomonas donggukensis]